MLPPRYTYMNYGAPYGVFVPGGTTAAPVGTAAPLPPGTFNPYYPYGAPIRSTQQATVAPKQSVGCNTNYLKSPLGALRLMLIPALIGTIIAAACVRNKSWDGCTESSWNTSVWITTLVFACVGLASVLLQYLMNVCNIVNISVCRIIPWTVLFALFDLAWFAAMTVLGAFCARREAVVKEPFRASCISKGAFGVTSGFSLLSALLFLLSGLTGLATCKAPKKTAAAPAPVTVFPTTPIATAIPSFPR